MTTDTSGDVGLVHDPEPRQSGAMLALRAAIVVTLTIGAVQELVAYTVRRAGLDLLPFENLPLTSISRPSLLVFLGSLAALALIIFGPAPRLATRWAWFWLSLPLNVGWAVFALIEPVMLLNGRPIARATKRLTGGLAFLMSIGIWILASAILPGLS